MLGISSRIVRQKDILRRGKKWPRTEARRTRPPSRPLARIHSFPPPPPKQPLPSPRRRGVPIAGGGGGEGAVDVGRIHGRCTFDAVWSCVPSNRSIAVGVRSRRRGRRRRFLFTSVELAGVAPEERRTFRSNLNLPLLKREKGGVGKRAFTSVMRGHFARAFTSLAHTKMDFPTRVIFWASKKSLAHFAAPLSIRPLAFY